MKDNITKHPVLFLDDWPQPPTCKEDEEFEKAGLTDVKKWRIQTLLSENPWGIPLLAFADAYKNMFGKELNLADLGFQHMSDMVSNLPDLFTTQEPDETTMLLFPDYPQDRILHDARLGHLFHQADCKLDPLVDLEALLARAWINRDEDLPADVVLPGEQYSELIFPMPAVNIPGTRGVYQAMLVGVATPNYFFINIKSDSLAPIARLSLDVLQYFKECGQPVEMFSIPQEFIYPGFPCLAYIEEEQAWERCAIRGRKITGRGKVLIETVDYGGSRYVSLFHLYLMPRKFLDIPKQGLLVSMAGLKPIDGGEIWPRTAGVRLRCFSNCNYWLEFLILDRKGNEEKKAEDLSKEDRLQGEIDSKLSGDCADQPTKNKKTLRSEPQFEALVCDRNDDDLDLHLDEVLIMERVSIRDEKRLIDIATLRQQFDEALKTIPRPENPLN